MTALAATVPARAEPAETLRLLDDLEAALTADGVGLPTGAFDPLRKAARTGDLPGALLPGPSGDAVGLAVWAPPTEVGRRLEAIHLARGYRTAAALDAFLSAVEQLEGELEVVAVQSTPAGFPPDAARGVLDRHGYRRVVRVDLAWPEEREAPLPDPSIAASLRPLRSVDEPALAKLLDRAYRDNPIDRALFRQRRDPSTDAELGVHQLVTGELGPWLDYASFGVELAPGGVAGATIVNEFHGALITEVMVDPAHRRRGYARALLAATLGALRARSHRAIRLVVTLSNERAHRLYRAMGFVPVPGSEGAAWLHADRLHLGPDAV